MTTCKNCENTFEGKFCPNCSQKADTHRLTVRHFAHEFFHAFTHTDRGILFLIKELWVRPGTVAREFNAGKRKKYFNPITYLLLIMALQIFLSQKTGIMSYYMEQAQIQNQASFTTQNEAETKKLTELMKTVEREVNANSKLLNFLFLPILAFFVWMLFRRGGYNYAEVLVLVVMYMAQTLLMFIIICIPLFLIAPHSIMITMNVYALFSLIYLIITLKQFFLGSWLGTILKGIAIQLLYYVSIFLIALIGVIVYFLVF